MILGIGTDLVDIRRIEKMLTRFGKRFKQRIFTPGERRIAEGQQNPATSYGKRFAAKEACAKALGTGIAAGLSWQDIEVVNAPQGKPILKLSPQLMASLEENLSPSTQIRLDLSLSDEYPYAQAFVVISQEGRTRL